MDQSASVCITDEKGVIVSVNDRFIQSTGYQREELVGNTTRILKSGYHGDTFYKHMWETISKGKIWNNEMKNKRKDDRFFWVNATIVPYLSTEGKPFQYILIGIDVTETKEIQQKMKEYLEEMQRTKNKIEKYSSLNQSLTMTLDKEQFFDIVFTYFQETYGFDKGILMDVKKKQHRTKGLREEKIESLLEKENVEEILSRLEEEKFFVIRRKAYGEEQGIAEEAFDCYDFYTGILSTEGTVEGFFALTRLGRPFSEEEIEEINGLMKQLAVALSRIDMYEQVENTKNLNENIIENVNEGLQLVSLEGKMLQYNNVLADLLRLNGYEGKLRVQQSIWIDDFIEGAVEKEKLKDFFRESIEFSANKSKNLRFTLEGEPPVFVELYASPVFMHEQKIGTIFVYRDITKEYEVDRMKSELVSTVSHELRTPLSSVLGFSEMLLMKELKPERQKKYLETIHKEATRLTNLINDFLDLQRMESGKQEYTMELHSVNEIAMEGIEKFKHESKHNVNIVDNARFAKAKVDRDRINQVFTNLISNSIKFSPEGGDVTITLKNRKDDLVVGIKDQGMGIPPEALTNIFDKFRRIDNSETRKIGGTGLGLSICKEIIEAHGGRIRIESIENQGTTVYFSLPAHIEDHEGDHGVLEKESEDNSDENGDNVMLVEDDISLALLLSETLKARGFKVFHHIRPQSALKNAKETNFSAVVVDLMLGDDMTGWDLIKELNEHKATKDIPVIISSALEKSEELIKNCKVYDYLVKPYSAEELLRIMLEIQGKKKSD
ncbi:hybrid sensor histidine kinase/response regulator [Isachenkonia alkalipeptolytica]|uniref:hybrid sensor histidine kinase/response regulator n=1 Tax=Isachenkonia alkalipeptolytica TaxID=2565777 RepID=UPI001F1911ED|nr:ATP-binding protein [Isachenkonia alkalipeptolytica]